MKKNKEFKLIKNGYIFEYNYNFGHINVENELTDECEDCIEHVYGLMSQLEKRLEGELYFQTNKALK